LGAWSLVQRVYYAYEDARSMISIQVLMVVVLIGGTLLARLLLAPRYWAVGSAWAMTLSYVVGAVLGLVAVGRRLHGIDARRVVQVHVKAVVAVGVATALAGLVLHLLGPVGGWADAVVTCVVGGVVLTATYGALLALMRVEELTVLVRTVAGRLGGRWDARRG
jgi:putative peptidoglycan lipid II flippase